MELSRGPVQRMCCIFLCLWQSYGDFGSFNCGQVYSGVKNCDSFLADMDLISALWRHRALFSPFLFVFLRAKIDVPFQIT